MKVCTCFLLFKIFAITNTLSQIKENGRRFKPALITKYSNEDTNNFNNRRDLTATVTDTALKVNTCTDFILETVNILNNYDDRIFEEFFHILDLEIIKFNYTGCKFSELMQNHNTKKLLVETFKTIRENPISFTKTKLNEMAVMLRNEMYGQNVKEFLNYINYLYTNKEPEFHRVLNNLKHYTKIQSEESFRKNFVQDIRDGIQTILFNHYSELDTYTRQEFKTNIETFWEKINKYPASNAEINHIHETDSVSRSVVNNIINEDKTPEIVINNYPKTKSLHRKKNIIDIKSDDQHFQDKENENDEYGNQSGIPAIKDNSDGISSEQSFDSSLNTIKQSQERFKQYSTEEVSNKARTTEKTEIIPISEKVMTRRATDSKRSTTTPRLSAKDVTSPRKKKLKQLPFKRHKHDPFDVSLYSGHETDDDLMINIKGLPRARVHSDKQRRAVDMPTETLNPNDAVKSVQTATFELLNSLSMLAGSNIFGTNVDTSWYQKSAGHNKLEPTKNKLPASIMPVQDETKPPKRDAVTKSPQNVYTKQPNELRRSIEPHLNNKELLADKALNDNKQNFARLHDDNKIKHFNEFVSLKIKTIQNELTELKQINDVVTVLKNNNTDEVDDRNTTRNDVIKDKDDNKRKHMKGNIMELLNRLREINYDKFTYNTRTNTVKTVSSTNTYTPYIAKIEKRDRAMDIVLDTTNPTIDNNVIITKTDTNELNKAVSNDNVTVNSTVGDRIIRHKNPFDHLDMKFLSRTL